MLSLKLIKLFQSSTQKLVSSSLFLISNNCKINHVQYNRIECVHISSPFNDLMEFFDDQKNWGETSVRSGRAWKTDELRIKSNTDLHKLWYVLYKERNMLMTMQEAAKDVNEPLPSPERIDKVEESMKNLETVVRERNKAYWELEVGEGHHGERQSAFRRDIFGRWRWIGCSEHLIPYYMNYKWRKLNAPGFGDAVNDFNKRLREKKMALKTAKLFNQRYYCRQLLRRFPDLDIEYLQEKFPDVNVKHLKENLNELLKKDRYRFRRGSLKEGR